MAQKTLVVLEDDIDGGDAEVTVKFSLDGVELRDRPLEEERRQAPGRLRQVHRRRSSGRWPHRARPQRRSRRRPQPQCAGPRVGPWPGSQGLRPRPDSGRHPEPVRRQPLICTHASPLAPRCACDVVHVRRRRVRSGPAASSRVRSRRSTAREARWPAGTPRAVLVH